MRPVTRGDAKNTYAKYQDAIGDLEERLGRYCSYCERRFPSSLAVEHIVPKSKNQDLELTWSNFLIGCTNCNSVKGAKPTNDNDFLWPDRDNTLLALSYTSGFVEVRQGLSAKSRTQATNTIELVGLERHPGQPAAKRPRKRDKRYMDREEAWKLATLKREALEKADTVQLREAIADLAKFQGFFSVWMDVFINDEDMRRRIVDAYVGTAADCFDKHWVAISRPGGHL